MNKSIIISEIEIAHNIFKDLERKCKEQKQIVEKAKRDYIEFKFYDDCADSYYNDYIKEQGILEGLVKAKISTERYYKKLRYEYLESLENN